MGDPAWGLPLHIRWDEGLSLVTGDGALPGCPEPTPGMSLAVALGVDPATARTLHERARQGGGVEFIRSSAGPGETPRWLRVAVRPAGTAMEARVNDLGALLEGAPPLQISQLSSSLSHELRNPLSSVKMAVQTLSRNEGLSPRDQRRLTIALREIRTLERMLWMLSEYGREGPLAVDAWALPDLIQESAGLIEQDLAERSVRVELIGADGLPRVRSDGVRLRPVLAQLLLNVAASLQDGEPLLVALRRSDRGAEVEVNDVHAALGPGDESRVFEPFGSRLARGAGLSLAALRRVLQQQGGEVSAEAARPPARGVLFRLDFARAS
ncbi:MAG TPA: histidine kinase dimerization/phospho-acceptor domain-containing protein [Myxococcaceae bacterium]|nr:histidine kinase dimerization/phospho-acceptor domain-containing protein [Myxococcaceae bacterium]